jgi:hypothetical protein
MLRAPKRPRVRRISVVALQQPPGRHHLLLRTIRLVSLDFKRASKRIYGNISKPEVVT